jgi:hypothetical protein
MIIASIISVLFLLSGFWKGRRFLACIVAIESMISTYLISSGLDENAILFACLTIFIYSTVILLCRKNAFICAAYAVLIVFSLFDFAISSLYAMAQTSELYYLALTWYYIYWPVFVFSVGLIITGLVKNDRNGRGTTDNLERTSNNSQLVFGVAEYQHKRHTQRFY